MVPYLTSRLLEIYRHLSLTRTMSPWRPLLLTLIHGSVAFGRAIQKDRVHVRAATLSYWSLVAMVPLGVLTLTLMGPLGLLDSAAVELRETLYQSVLAESVTEVAAWFEVLLAGVKLQTLGVVGFGAALLAGSKIYFSVEQAYNDIFSVRIHRRWLLRLVLFYAMVTLGPLLLSLGFVATSHLGSTLPSGLFGRMVPIGLTTLAFVLGIKLLPQVNVHWRAALAGGLTSGILFEVAKYGFGSYTRLLGGSSSIALVYGSLGLVPVFLFWLYLLWMITLLGVELASVVQHASHLLPQEEVRLLQPDAWRRQPDPLFGLQALTALANHFMEGAGAMTVEDVAMRLGASSQAAGQALEVLESAGMVLRIEDGGFTPARPMDRLRAAEVIRAWRNAGVPTCKPGAPGAFYVDRAMEALDWALDTSVANCTNPDEPDKA